MRVMRMRADRAEHVFEALGDRQHFGVAPHPGRDRYNFRQTRRLRALDDAVELRSEIRKIEMAMAVDQHGVRRHRRSEETPRSAPGAWCRPRAVARRRA